MAEDIPDHLKAFLRDVVTTFEALEAILCLHAQPGRAWSTDDLAAAIRISVPSAAETLEALHRNAVVAIDTRNPAPLYRYSPATPVVERAANDLARTFSEQRASILRVMNAYAVERVRSNAVRAFAHAFIIGKKKDNDDG
jgi:hypothetical protein